MNLNELDEKAKNSLKEQDETKNEWEEQIKLIQEISEINEIQKAEKAKVESTPISEEKPPEKKDNIIKIVDVHVGKKYLFYFVYHKSINYSCIGKWKTSLKMTMNVKKWKR